MRPDRRVGNAERRGDIRYAADFGDGQQDAQLGRRQLECLADDLGGRSGDQGSSEGRKTLVASMPVAAKAQITAVQAVIDWPLLSARILP